MLYASLLKCIVSYTRYFCHHHNNRKEPFGINWENKLLCFQKVMILRICLYVLVFCLLCCLVRCGMSPCLLYLLSNWHITNTYPLSVMTKYIRVCLVLLLYFHVFLHIKSSPENPEKGKRGIKHVSYSPLFSLNFCLPCTVSWFNWILEPISCIKSNQDTTHHPIPIRWDATSLYEFEALPVNALRDLQYTQWTHFTDQCIIVLSYREFQVAHRRGLGRAKAWVLCASF